MALLSRLQRETARRAAEDPTPVIAPDQSKLNAHQELKFRVHNRLFELLDLAKLQKVSEDRIREDIAVATRRVLEEEKVLLTLEERDRLVREIQDEVLGLGPLEPLLQDPAVADILVYKALNAARSRDCKTIVISGGVSANSRLRSLLRERAAKHDIGVCIPPRWICTDNAAMIAGLGYHVMKAHLESGGSRRFEAFDLDARSSWPVC